LQKDGFIDLWQVVIVLELTCKNLRKCQYCQGFCEPNYFADEWRDFEILTALLPSYRKYDDDLLDLEDDDDVDTGDTTDDIYKGLGSWHYR
jgi:hypothetical protein